MEKNNILHFLEKFRDLEISKEELTEQVGNIPFGKEEGILTPQHVIYLLEAFKENKINEVDITNWVDIVWWSDWFKSEDKYLASIASVIGALDMLEDIPYLRINHLTNEEAQYYINALIKNKDISFEPYKLKE